LGLRLEDVAGLESEPVYLGDGDKENRREKLQENGAIDEEIDFLLDVDNPSEHWGKRVELNAFGSRQLIEFIERKLTEHGLQKVVPDAEKLADAYKLFARADRIKEVVEEAIKIWTMMTLKCKRILSNRCVTCWGLTMAGL
jgi:hypothetical protein